MINILNVIDELKINISKRFPFVSSIPSNLEKEISNKITDIFVELVYNSEIKEDNSLTLKEYSDITIDNVENSSQLCSQTQSQKNSSQISQISSTYSISETLTIENEEFSFEYIQKVINYINETPNAKFKSIQKKF